MHTLQQLIERGEARPGGGVIIDRSYPRDGLCIDCGEALHYVADTPYRREGRTIHHEQYDCLTCRVSYFVEWVVPIHAEAGSATL